MKNLETFESFNGFNYDRILSILRKVHGWGNSCNQQIKEFESSEFFKNPIDNNDYVEQFHIFLTDKFIEHGNDSLKVGKWRGQGVVQRPVSIYNQMI